MKVRCLLGFTMVEVLVCVAIIATLAGLLTPAILLAKGAAKSAACIGNLTQIGRATSLYLADYDDWFPASLDAWAKVHSNFEDEATERVPALHVALSPYVNEPRVFRCPDDHGTVDEHGRPVATPSMFEAVGSSYSSHNLPNGMAMSQVRSSQSTLVWQSTGQVHRPASSYRQVVHYQVHADFHVSVSAQFFRLR